MAGKRLALIVATDEYSDPGLRKLRAPGTDADALAGALGDPELGEFDVDVLRNETSSTISERVETLLSGGRPEDLIVLHFSCHGLKDDSGELYLAATNTHPGLLASTAVDAALVNRLMRRSRAQRIVLFLDCCYGGAFERGMVPRAAGVMDVADQFQQQDAELSGGRGRVVITASNAMEFAFEGTDLADSISTQPSIFTGALVEGLTTGKADRDQDGMVSLGELYDYVFDRVRQESPNQTPGKWEFGLQGELFLAKNPQRVVVPAPIPADLLALIEHPFAATRLGSVEALTRLAESANLPIAAGARNALEQMVTDDSRAVAAAATQAVASTSLHLSAAVVDFGIVEVGATVPATEIAIQGVPLTMASRVEASIPSLHVRRVDRTIRIEAVTEQAGQFDGIVTVTGPAGNAELHVIGVVVPTPSTDGARQVSRRKPYPAAPISSDARPTEAERSIESAAVRMPVAGDESPAVTNQADPSARAPVATPPTTAPSGGPADHWWERSRLAVRRLIERGWRTGHVQTLIGAELGAYAVITLDLPYQLHDKLGFIQDAAYELAYASIWFAAVVVALVFLRLAGPQSSWWKTVIALVILYPLFRGMADGTAIYAANNLPNTLISLIIVAAIALVASSVVLLRRPGAV